MTTIIILYATLAVFGFWIAYCSDKAVIQRAKITDLYGYDVVESVTFDEHFWHVFTFRNPHNLYYEI